LSDQPPPRQLTPALLVICLLAVFVFTCLLFVPFTSDDAYITMRYARHAAAGEGLVYNPGERVEGYSNPLWLGLLVVAAKLGLDLVVAAKLLGIIAGALSLLLALGIILRLTDGHNPLAYYGLLPLCTSAALGVYAASGLETILYACFLTALVYCWLSFGAASWWALAACALAAAFTRPEGALVLVLIIGWRGLHWLELPPRVQRHYLLSLPLIGLVLALFFMSRHAYFGAWLPNTFYAKPPGAFGTTSLLSPLTYLRDFVQDTGAWLWLGLSVTLVLVARRRSAALAALLIVGAQVALVVHARGDWMALHRFLLPTLPLLVAVGYVGLLRLSPPRPVLTAILSLIVLLNVVHVFQVRKSFLDGIYPYSVMAGQPQEMAGKWLARHFPPDTTVATKRIGGVGYFSKMRVVDTLGLVDRPIALIRHGSPARGEAENQRLAEEVFSRRPDLILLAVMKRWDQVPLDQPPPDLAANLRDVDNALYAGLSPQGYRFIYRLPQGGDGEFAVFARPGLSVPPLSPPY
jgi:hypothetical protein